MWNGTNFLFAHSYPSFHPTIHILFIQKFKMIDKIYLAIVVVVIDELIKSDDEKSCHGKLGEMKAAILITLKS